jgi:hypothetical protein
MLTRRLFAIPFAVSASLVLATAVLAGGWASVAISDPPADPTAGGETVIDLTVLQHGVTPINWIGLTVVATNGATGETVSATAQPIRQGEYQARLTFPSAGDWSLAFTSGDLMVEGTGALAIAVGAPAPIAGVASGATSSALAIVLGLLVAGFLATFAIMVIRDRRRDRTVVTAS